MIWLGDPQIGSGRRVGPGDKVHQVLVGRGVGCGVGPGDPLYKVHRVQGCGRTLQVQVGRGCG